jgi:curved DNA-binding protein CbpA
MAGLSIKGAVSVVDHYERLKISRDAPLEVIRAAYRALAAKHHPDRHGQSEGANTDMAALNAAYEVLCDPEARAVYDASLLSEGPAAMFGAEPPDIAIQPTRRSRPRPRPEPAGEPASEFQPDIDWSSLVAKPKVNPWLTASRLGPLGGLVAALILGGTYWWSQMLSEQMASERLLASSYLAQAKAASHQASGAALAKVPTAKASSPLTLPPLRPLRHPLDGEPLSLKSEGELVDPLGKP